MPARLAVVVSFVAVTGARLAGNARARCVARWDGVQCPRGGTTLGSEAAAATFLPGRSSMMATARCYSSAAPFPR